MFVYFRHISLFNLIYKLISKIDANHLKPFLDKAISTEQYGFLKNRKILEHMGITQEILHSIKTKKLKALVLKLDLVKAFEKVNWTFLRLVLLQIGVHVDGVNWIMGSIISSNFFGAG